MWLVSRPYPAAVYTCSVSRLATSSATYGKGGAVHRRALEEVYRWLRAWQPSSGVFRAAGLDDPPKTRTRTRVQVSHLASDPGQSMIWGEVTVVCNPRALPITSMQVMSKSHAADLVRDEMPAYKFVTSGLPNLLERNHWQVGVSDTLEERKCQEFVLPNSESNF